MPIMTTSVLTRTVMHCSLLFQSRVSAWCSMPPVTWPAVSAPWRWPRRYSFVYASVGIHPHAAGEVFEDASYLEQLALWSREEKVRAIGEIGLDYHYDFSPREQQKAVFAQQLQLAGELNLPVIIHSREALADTLELLKRYRPKGIVHCYTGSAEMVPEFLRLGLYIGFTGSVTFKNANKILKAAAAVPLDRLLVETDSPICPPNLSGERGMIPHVFPGSGKNWLTSTRPILSPSSTRPFTTAVRSTG